VGASLILQDTDVPRQIAFFTVDETRVVGRNDGHVVGGDQRQNPRDVRSSPGRPVRWTSR
jgi:hypothetical protein